MINLNLLAWLSEKNQEYGDNYQAVCMDDNVRWFESSYEEPLRKALDSFYWDSTPQSHRYWSRIMNDIIDEEGDEDECEDNF